MAQTKGLFQQRMLAGQHAGDKFDHGPPRREPHVEAKHSMRAVRSGILEFQNSGRKRLPNKSAERAHRFGHRMGAVHAIEFAACAHDVRFHGRLGNEQNVGDGGIRLSSRTPLQDFYAGLAVP
jgi:hypothetical protein